MKIIYFGFLIIFFVILIIFSTNISQTVSYVCVEGPNFQPPDCTYCKEGWSGDMCDIDNSVINEDNGYMLYTIDDFIKNNSQLKDWRYGTIYEVDNTWETEVHENNWLLYNPTYEITFKLSWTNFNTLNVTIYDDYYSYKNEIYPNSKAIFGMSVNNYDFPFATNGELFIQKGTYIFYDDRVVLQFR